MKVGDLVQLSGAFSGTTVIQDWGLGLIDAVYKDGVEVEVIWPQKSWTSRTLPRSRVEVVNESR